MISPETINLLKPYFKQLLEAERQIELILLGQPELEAAIEEFKEKKAKKKPIKIKKTKKEAPKEKYRRITPENIKEIQKMKNEGFTSADIAEGLDIPLRTVNRYYATFVKEKL